MKAILCNKLCIEFDKAFYAGNQSETKNRIPAGADLAKNINKLRGPGFGDTIINIFTPTRTHFKLFNQIIAVLLMIEFGPSFQ